MPAKKSPDRPWTRKEEQRAVALRRARHTIASTARILGRSYAQVSVKLSRLGATKKSARPRRKRGEFAAAVRATCRLNRTDRRVAELLGTTPQEVFKARKKLGIKSASWFYIHKAVVAGAKKKRVTRMRCWGCDRRRKIGEPGWETARFMQETEAYCPSCVKVHGLPRRFGQKPIPKVHQRTWAAAEDAKLLALADGRSAAEFCRTNRPLAELFGRSVHSIHSRLWRLRNRRTVPTVTNPS